MKKNNIKRVIISAVICIIAIAGIFAGTTIKKMEPRKVPEKKVVKSNDIKASQDNNADTKANTKADSNGFKDGTYEGTGSGYKGEVKVSVTVSSGKITNIDILSNVDDAEYFNSAKALIPAVIEAQSVDIDTVTGATYSSMGILEAVYNALEKGGN